MSTTISSFRDLKNEPVLLNLNNAVNGIALNVPVYNTDPAGATGGIYYNSTDGTLYVNDGTTWFGVNGVTGSQGYTGPQGLQGVTGFQGSTGFQGATGLQGFTGSIGFQGATGLQGSTGIRGATGVQGVTGFQGATGGSAISFYEAILNGSVSATTATLQNISGLTLTPLVPGTYFVMFTLAYDINNTATRTVQFDLAKNGTQITNSLLTYSNDSSSTTAAHNVTVHANTTCNGTDVITARWAITAFETLRSSTYRRLFAMKLTD